jgi:putative zinc finger/helix-turn-helix YgiT family protein
MNTVVRGVCSNCEKETRFEPVTKEEVIRVRNKPITIELQYLKCAECGDEVFDPGLNVDPFSLAYRKYRKEYGFLQPEEIREWRKANKLTQGELAKLLGLGGVTISRYENGALQDPSHEKLLRLAMNPSNLLQLIEGSEGVFTESKKRRLVEALQQVEAGANSIDSTIMVSFGNYEPNEHSGYRKLDLEKLYNVILFFCKGGVLKTKLNKLLFYADFRHYKEYAISITGARYAHVPFGPAPDNYEIYYGALSSQKAIEFVEEIYPSKYGGEPVVGEIIKATRKPDLTVFAASELRIMASVQEDFAKYSASEITDFSHKEVGYPETRDGDTISYTNHCSTATFFPCSGEEPMLISTRKSCATPTNQTPQVRLLRTRLQTHRLEGSAAARKATGMPANTASFLLP